MDRSPKNTKAYQFEALLAKPAFVDQKVRYALVLNHLDVDPHEMLTAARRLRAYWIDSRRHPRRERFLVRWPQATDLKICTEAEIRAQLQRSLN